MTAPSRSAVLGQAASTVSLARDLHRNGRLKAAEALFKHAAVHVETALGPDDVGLVCILEAYAEFLVSIRRESEAAPIRDRSNQIRGRARPASA